MRLADVKTVVSLGVWQPSKYDDAAVKDEFAQFLDRVKLGYNYLDVREPSQVRDLAGQGLGSANSFHRDDGCGCQFEDWDCRGVCRHRRDRGSNYLAVWSSVLPTELRDSRKRPIEPFPEGSVLILDNWAVWHRSPRLPRGVDRWFIRASKLVEVNDDK